MKTTLKLLFVLTSLACTSSYADTCREYKNDIKTHCQVVADACTSIKSCLTRRDTCVPSVPSDSTSCVGLNTCMDDIKDQLPSSDRCKYHWNDSGSFCTTKRHWIYSEDGCPGKMGGIINNLAYGFASEIDSDFNCKPTRHKYQIQKRGCLEAIDTFKSNCMAQNVEEDERFVEENTPAPCIEDEEFDSYREGDFELPSSASGNGEDQYDGSRSNKKVAPQTDDRAPEQGSRTIQQ